MNIADFARSHDASPDAVRMWISRNPDKFPEGAISRKSGHRDAELSAAAVAVLEQVYPLPKPVQIVQHDPEDVEELRVLRKRVDALQDTLIATQQALIETEREKGEAQRQLAANAALIEAKEKEAETREKETAALQERLEEAESRAERLKGRGLWARLLNKEA